MNDESISKKLPDSWAELPLGKVIQLQYGKSLTAKNRVKNGIVKVFGSSGHVGNHNQALINEPCIIVGRKGSVGNVFISEQSCWPIDTVYFVIPPVGVDIKFLFYQLEHLNLAQLDKSTAIPGLNRDDAYKSVFNLAPESIQKLIVEKIEELFSHIDAGVEGLKQAKTKLQQYRQSVLKDAVTGKLTEQWREQNADKLEPADELLELIIETRRANWEAEQLKSFADKGTAPKSDKWKEEYVKPKAAIELEDLPNGWVSTITDQIFSFVTSGSRGWAKYYSDEGPLFLRVGNLFHYNAELDLRKLQRVSPPEGTEGSRTKVQEGDNLISITADVGMVGYVPRGFEEAYINQHVALARPVKKEMGKYLSWLLSGDFAKEQFKALQKGATKAGLGLDDIRSISFGLPSILEQEQIVQAIESKISGIDRLKKETELKILQASKLKSSILADAFSGKLVDNIETDETVEQLLEKIKVEQEQLISVKPKSTTERKNKVTSERKPLQAVLSEQSEAITPDVLMQEAGFTSVDIDDFYVELASIAEKIEQISPEQELLKSWPYDKAATIKLKLKD
jgi:type I restriction enzyme S subunit